MEINRKNARIWSMMGSRGTFGEIIAQLSKERNDFFVLSADLSRSAGLDKFKQLHPEQFLNVGIAEQNLIGIASGIANEGISVFAISYSPFATMRVCEQIRVNLGYMELGVTVVGLSSGFEHGFLGNSHYGTEDVSTLRNIPNITIVSPADGIEIVKTVCAAVDYKKPLYIRLTGTNNMPIVYTKDYDFEFGKAIELKEGDDVAIFACGSMVAQGLKAAKLLEEHGISAAVINMHTIKPLDKNIVKKYLQKVKLMVTVEEHSVIGGLGSAVAEEMSELKHNCVLRRIGSPDSYEKAGSYDYMLRKFGLTSENIAQNIMTYL